MSDRGFVPALRLHALTSFYDPVVAFTTRERRFKTQLLEQLSPAPGARILDLGCGTGTLAIQIKQAWPETEVVGLDADPAMLDRARTKAGEHETEIRFDQAYADQLSYDDESFDLVVSSLFFHHLERAVKQRTAREIARVLDQDGELHVADWGRPQDPLMKVLATSIRLLDGFEPTRDNLQGALPQIFASAGLVSVTQLGQLRTAFGTLAFYRANAPPKARAGGAR